jgi:ABC-type multidrug transport system fused ATPase/permease subunit
LSTVRDAALLYVIEDGRVVESGTHDELSRGGQRYAALLQQLSSAAAPTV